MIVVTFWNNNTGKIGQTHSAMAIATHMAIEHNQKILLMSTKYNDLVTLQAFGFNKIMGKAVNLTANNKVSMDLESGIEGMSKLANANRLEANVIPNYTRPVFKRKLEILTAPADRANGKIDYPKIYSSCKTIISTAKRYYDIVFVDLNNGLDDPTTREILGISNIIILNFEQKPSEIEKALKIREKETLFSPKNTMILINRYDRHSKYSTKNISRELLERREILSVPYNHIFAESVQEGTIAEFFLNPKVRKMNGSEDGTTFFMSELKRAEEEIIFKAQELQMRI